MGNAAVVQFVGYFRQTKFAVNEHFLHPFNLVANHKLLNSHTLCFRKDISQVGIIIVQFLT